MLPYLAVGFILSGLIHEFLPSEWVERHLAGRGVKPVLYSTLIGTILPICCFGSLPVAVSLHRKGARLGPVLAEEALKSAIEDYLKKATSPR